MAEPLRAVIDTNIWISAFINIAGSPARLLSAFLAGAFLPVISEALIAELRDVSARAHLLRRYRMAVHDRDYILGRIESDGVRVRPPGSLRLCRDAKDDMVLETAILGRAQYLVTRDDDIKRDEALIAALAEHGVRVVTVARMLDILGEPDIQPGG